MENTFRLDGVEIAGLSACLPARRVDNEAYGRELYAGDLAGTLKVIGVRERRFREDGVTSLDLCVQAAQNLADYAQMDYASFGGLVFVTMTPDFSMPNNASYAHKLLGFGDNTPAFDISMACSGYPYGLWIAGMMAKSAGKKVLLLDGDTHSPFISPHDRSTSLLFGDGGTATVLSPSAQGGTWYFDFVTAGDRETLVVPESGFRNRVDARSADYLDYPDGSRRRQIDLKMDGMGVFNSVVKNAPPSMKRIMEAEGAASEDYDFLLLHQANGMMIDQLAKKMKFDAARFPKSLDRYGNIGSGSIPLNICSELKERTESARSRVLMSAFGAGFSVGSCSVELGPCPCAGVADFEVRNR